MLYTFLYSIWASESVANDMYILGHWIISGHSTSYSPRQADLIRDY